MRRIVFILFLIVVFYSFLTGNNTKKGPGNRSQHVLAYDQQRDKIILYGDTTRETWELSGKKWTLMNTTGPIPALKSAMVYDETNMNIVLFGGYDLNRKRFNDTLLWDGAKWSKKKSRKTPAPRSNHAMCYHSKLGKIVLYGGIDRVLWTWDGKSWEKLASYTLGPIPSFSYNSMVYDSIRNRLVHHYEKATWEWDEEKWIKVSDNGPKRSFHAMAFDKERGKVVLFGGTEYVKSLNETWEWDGIKWDKVSETGPSPRQDHAMVYDPKQKKVVLYGGSGLMEKPFRHFRKLDDTWAWDGKIWAKIETSVDESTSLKSTKATGDAQKTKTKRLDKITSLGIPFDTKFKKEKIKVYIVKILTGFKTVTRAVAPYGTLTEKIKKIAQKKGYKQGDLVRFVMGEKKGSIKIVLSTEKWDN